MHAYERNGVVVDQCTECRGIFLDRGELEHLIDAEARFNSDDAARPGAPTPTHPAYPPAPAPTYPQTPQYPQAPQYAQEPYPPSAAGPASAGRSPTADLSTIASMATEYLGKSKGKKKGKKGSKSFIAGLFG